MHLWSDWIKESTTRQIWSYHGPEDFEVCLLICDATWTCRWVPTFRRNMLYQSSERTSSQYVFPKQWHVPTSPHAVTTSKTNTDKQYEFLLVEAFNLWLSLVAAGEGKCVKSYNTWKCFLQLSMKAMVSMLNTYVPYCVSVRELVLMEATFLRVVSWCECLWRCYCVTCIKHEACKGYKILNRPWPLLCNFFQNNHSL